MGPKRLAVFDPSGRLIADLQSVAEATGVRLTATRAVGAPDADALLIAPAVAADLGPARDGGSPRWIVGDGGNAGRIAGAAAQAGAIGVLLTPVSPAALVAITEIDRVAPEVDLARARGLIATSLVDLTGAATETLEAVTQGFSAHDCIVWWRDGNQMTPTSARAAPTDDYRTQIAGAARIAAASSGTVITGGPSPRSVIADALRASPTEVAGLVAIVVDHARRFSTAERTDLKAIGTRLARELSWLSSHRRLVAEGERLLAASLHDPLTGAMTRGAFEQTIAHEAAAAARRKEPLTLAVIDVVGLRQINLQHGHKAGDEVLAQVASRIRATVRGNDPIGRLGGDEIAVLLVGARDEQAALVARKLIFRIQHDPITVDTATEISIKVRAVASEIAADERSGEAAFARCYASLRSAPIGDVQFAATDSRAETDAGGDPGQLSAGTIVGGTYRVVHELSRGAMGVVYRGEDLGLGRPVAIKVLRSDLASDRELVARFRAEAGLLASLHHPNLVQVYALGEHAGDVYFVMELVEGQPLSELLRAHLESQAWFPTAAISQITLEIGDALDAMHALGVIHRDVKPANVLVDRERDRAVLVDVGVAVRAGDQRDVAGTPGFAAPESFVEHAESPAADVYGLAATVYTMLSGRAPFGSGTAPQVVQRQLNDTLTPVSQLRSSLSTAVDDVLRKALHPRPEKRWATASTFAVALGRALERSPRDDATRGHSPTLPPMAGGDPPVVRPVHLSGQIQLVDPVAMAEAVLAPTSALEWSNVASTGEFSLPALGGPRVVAGQVRAAHLRVLSRLLQHHLGESGLAKLVEEFPNLAHAMTPALAPLGWIDLVDLVEALECARGCVPSQLVPHKVGRNTMSATFSHLFGADPSSLPTETVLAALPSFWTRFHDWGAVEIEVHPGGADLVLHGYAGSTDICALVGSELERIVELTGARAVGAAHTACACIGDHECEFRLSWTPP